MALKLINAKVPVSAIAALAKQSRDYEKFKDIVKSAKASKSAEDKTLKDAKKGVKDYEDAIKEIEDDCASLVRTLIDKLDEVRGELADIKKRPVLPDTVLKAVTRLQDIDKNGRQRDIKDLLKEQSRQSLRSNPSKLERLIKDINSDVTDTNALTESLEKAIEKATDDMFAARVDDLDAKIRKALPTGVRADGISLDTKLKGFAESCKKDRWKNFDTRAKAFEDEINETAKEKFRLLEISQLQRNSDFFDIPEIDRKKAYVNAMKAGSTITAATIRADFVAQLAAIKAKEKFERDNPHVLKVAQWADLLGLKSSLPGPFYKKFEVDSIKMHITIDKNCWTSAARAGVSARGATVDQIFTALFKVDDMLQFHCTIEIKNSNSNTPKIFAFGTEIYWAEFGRSPPISKDKAWVFNKAKPAIEKELKEFIKDIKNKIAAAIVLHKAK